MGIFKPLPPRLQRGHPLAYGLVGAWEFTEGSGLTVYDTSGYGNNLNLSNAPTWIGGPRGSALSFNGTNQRGNTGSPPILDFGAGSFSINVWVNSSATNVFALGKRIDSSSSGFDMLMGGGGVAGVNSFRIAHNTVNVSGASTSGLNDGKWHHYVGVIDRVAQLLITYVDGAHLGTDANISSVGSVTSASAFNVAARNSTSFMAGSVDDVRLYNRALSAAEAAMIYQMTGPAG